MAPIRPYWKGYLKLSLDTCPVQMMPATTESEKVKFNILSRTTQNQVVSHYVDAVTGNDVADGDKVKGYVILEDDELDGRKCRSVVGFGTFAQVVGTCGSRYLASGSRHLLPQLTSNLL